MQNKHIHKTFLDNMCVGCTARDGLFAAERADATADVDPMRDVAGEEGFDSVVVAAAVVAADATGAAAASAGVDAVGAVIWA